MEVWPLVQRAERARYFIIQNSPFPQPAVPNTQHHYGGPVIDLKKLVREIPDYPKPGILFYDITTLLKDPVGLHWAVDVLANTFLAQKIDRVIGIEARGFIFAPMVAYRLNAGFVPARKPNKLPAERATMPYSLEYGNDAIEIHRDAISKGQEVLIIDDLLATGGTAAATARLVESLGGRVAGIGFVIELKELKGREKLSQYAVHSILKY